MGAFIIWLMACAVFFVFGIYALFSKGPVGFWNFQEKIRVSNVKGYNRAVAKLWFVSAVVFGVIGIPLMAGQNSAWVAIPVLGGMVWAIVLMTAYVRIEKKYRVS